MRRILRNSLATADGVSGDDSASRRHQDVTLNEETSDSECGSREGNSGKIARGKDELYKNTMSTSATESNNPNDRDESKENCQVCWTSGNTRKSLPAESMHREAGHTPDSLAKESHILARRVTRTKFIVLFLITTAAAMVAYSIFHFASEQEVVGYRSRVCPIFRHVKSTLEGFLRFASHTIDTFLFLPINSLKMHLIKSWKSFALRPLTPLISFKVGVYISLRAFLSLSRIGPL